MKEMMFFFPCSKSLNYWWNSGSLLGMSLVVQIFTGIMMVFFYNMNEGFWSVCYMNFEVNLGWLMHLFHMYFASVIFFLLYIHMLKGLRMMSVRLLWVWWSGMSIFVVMMVEAFLGYVCLDSQMSFWAAIVITQLLSIFPMGDIMVVWLWGNLTIFKFTMNFFFCLHFILGFLLIFMVMMHLYFLHLAGSTSLVYIYIDEKINFYIFFVIKDMMNMVLMMFFFLMMMFEPFLVCEYDMFEEKNIIMSPRHIVPEWYFLIFYAVLRSFNNKIVGVIFMVLIILMFFFLYLFSGKSLDNFLVYYLLLKVMIFWELEKIGGSCPEYPYVFTGQLFFFFSVVLDLMFILINYLNKKIWL